MLKASCEVINRIYLSKSKTNKAALEGLTKYSNIDDIQKNIDKAIDEQKVIDSEIDDIIKKKQSASDDIEKTLLDRQYKERITEYQRLEKLIFSLGQKQQDAEYAKMRIQKMGELLKGQKLTPETITKSIVDTFIQSIIVLNRKELVFVLPSEEKVNYHIIKGKRFELIEHPSIIEGNIHLDRHFKPEDLHYKVVMM